MILPEPLLLATVTGLPMPATVAPAPPLTPVMVLALIMVLLTPLVLLAMLVLVMPALVLLGLLPVMILALPAVLLPLMLMLLPELNCSLLSRSSRWTCLSKAL